MPDKIYTPPQYPPKTGTELVREELAELREQVAQLTQRVQALEQPPRPQPDGKFKVIAMQRKDK